MKVPFFNISVPLISSSKVNQITKKAKKVPTAKFVVLDNHF